METGPTAFIFFAGIFWATALGRTADYRGFDTAAILSKDHWCLALRRFLVSLVLLNASPILLLLALYYWVVPSTSELSAVALAAVAALSLFGFHRVLFAIVASNKTHSFFYTPKEWKDLCDRVGQTTYGFWAHLLPGALYLSFFPLTAKFLADWL